MSLLPRKEQVQRQFRGPSTPELLNADIAPLLSVCKKVGVEIENFPTLNAPSPGSGPGYYTEDARVGHAGRCGPVDSHGQL